MDFINGYSGIINTKKHFNILRRKRKISPFLILKSGNGEEGTIFSSNQRGQFFIDNKKVGPNNSNEYTFTKDDVGKDLYLVNYNGRSNTSKSILEPSGSIV